MRKRWKCTVCGEVFYGERPPIPCPICGASEDAFIELPPLTESAFRKDTLDRFVIIGGGAAGINAAKAIRARNISCTISIVAGEGLLPYNRPALTDVLADGLSFDNIALDDFDYYSINKLELITDALAERIAADEKVVYLSGGRKLPYDKLLIATGANSFNPLKRDQDAIPMFTLRHYSDALSISDSCAGKRAIVVGGGILGLEAALALKELGATVTVFELSERALPLQADARASKAITQAFTRFGINIITQKSVARFTQLGAILTDETEIEADCALVSIGVRSDIALAQTAGLTTERGIVVDEFMRTSGADIFAAGDCAQYSGRVQGLWAAAVEQGQLAGAAMAGDFSACYSPIVPATSLEVGEVKLFSAGTLGSKRHITYEDAQSCTYRRLYIEGDRLTGAVFVGDTSKSAEVIARIADGGEFCSILCP